MENFNRISRYKGLGKDYFLLKDFDKIPALPGIYSWHFIPKEQGASIATLYNSKNFDVKVSSDLGFSASGIISQTNLIEENNTSSIFSLASMMFAPPVYIGISYTSLNRRLNEHKTQLIHVHNSGANKKIKDKPKSDTFEESSFFAQRVGLLFSEKKINWMLSQFLVRVIFSDQRISKTELTSAEFSLNRTFFPILGRL